MQVTDLNTESTRASKNPYRFEYSIPYFLDDLWGRKMHVAERARQCVVFLGIMDGERFGPKGTAFFVTYDEYEKKFLHLVTAQHVIIAIQEHSDTVHIRHNLKEGGVGDATTPIESWYFHPDADRFVDVAVVPVGPGREVEFTYTSNSDFVTQDLIDEYQMSTGDDVFVTGLFVSHYGVGKNVPIVRTGNIAAMPEEPVWTNSGYIDAYLIEGRSIGGISGSPVFFQPAPFRSVDGTVKQSSGKTHYLLGLVHGHFDVKEVMDIVQDEQDYAKTNKLHSGIAIVVPSDKIIETLEQEELKQHRKDVVEKAKAESDAVPDALEEQSDISGDDILKNMLDTPPETHEEMKKK